MEEFCRDIVRAARASEAEVEAAANAPFLYPRLLARIAAEQAARDFVVERNTQNGKWDFFALHWAWQWRWVMTITALALFAFVGWYWLRSSPAEPRMARHQKEAAAPATPTPQPIVENSASEEARALPSPIAKTKSVTKQASRKPHREVPAQNMEETEIATDYIPLTYVANGEERSGEVVRVEMPRSAMLAMGLPVNAESSGELVKADVIVGDDGLALAIRFVR